IAVSRRKPLGPRSAVFSTASWLPTTTHPSLRKAIAHRSPRATTSRKMCGTNKPHDVIIDEEGGRSATSHHQQGKIMTDKFEDYCWKDVVKHEILKIYEA